MRKRTRRVLFWIAVIIFGATSGIIIQYARGYKYDFSARRFVLTGAFAVTANADAELIMNGNPSGSLSFLNHNGGVNRLLPGSYTIQLLKDGWSSWRKTATVQEGLLTDFPSVLLLPTDTDAKSEIRKEIVQGLTTAITLANATPTPSPRPRQALKTPQIQSGIWLLQGRKLFRTDTASASMVADAVLGFTPSDNGDRVLWWTQNELWVTWNRNTDYQPYRIDGDRELVARWSVPIVRATWFRDRDHIAVDLGSSGYRIVEIDLRGGANIIKI